MVPGLWAFSNFPSFSEGEGCLNFDWSSTIICRRSLRPVSWSTIFGSEHGMRRSWVGFILVPVISFVLVSGGHAGGEAHDD